MNGPEPMTIRRILAALTLSALSACSREPAPTGTSVDVPEDGGGGITSLPLRDTAPRDSPDDPIFTGFSAEDLGVDFTNTLTREDRLTSAFSDPISGKTAGNVGSGVCSGDFDGDGLIDLYFVAQTQPDRLFRQTSPWKFEDVTEQAGGVSGPEGSGTGASFSDIDNDGDLDLYVCSQDSADLLYVNQGDGRFREEGGARGLGDDGPGVMAAFCDYDRDGDLDLYLVRNRPPGGLGTSIITAGVFDKKDREAALLAKGIASDEAGGKKVGLPDILYRNDGNGHFTDVSVASGIGAYRGMGLSATWWDGNGDGWPDLYVANDFGEPDRYFLNRGDGSFEEVAAEAFPLMPWFSMGSDSADLNNDGLLDLIGTDMAGTSHFEQKIRMGDIAYTKDFLTYTFPEQMMSNTVFLNSGVGRFFEVARITGMSSSDWTWAVRIADFDNDGKQDVFFSNGFYANARDSDQQLARQLLDEWLKAQESLSEEERTTRFIDYLEEKGFPSEIYDEAARPPLAQKNLLFRNEGDLRFANVTDQWGFDEPVVSFGVTVADLDGDGDLDIVANGLDGSIRFYRNESDSGNRMIVSLQGSRSNHFGIGAKVTIETEAGIQTRLLRASRGYLGGDHPELHFGLGDETKATRLTVEWPGGHLQEFENLPTGFRHRISEPSGMSPPLSAAAPPRFGPDSDDDTIFREVASALPDPVVHHEQYYDDFSGHLLLPYQLSQMGPGVAVGNIDGDESEEIWTGGAFGQLGQVIDRDGDGIRRLRHGWYGDSRGDAVSEDLGGLFFDADGDGDSDLYVASGGVEAPVGDDSYRDRLYLNRDGVFEKSPEGSLPDLRDSSGGVTTADFDRDGDLDLFVAARLVPGGYPEGAQSRLLRNEGGARFVDATSEVFSDPAAVGRGMVTSSLWSDFDGDGWIDLLMTEDWGPVRSFRNREGRLEESTESSGIGGLWGWWNGIAGGDIDHDGDIDYVATNFGLNTKYKPTAELPVQMFYSDFDGNGKMDVVEATYSNGKLVPVRGRSCSSLQIPGLAKSFSTYRKFAAATLSEIYQPETLENSLKREARHLSTTLLRNDGNGVFHPVPLPRFAQISPSFGVAIQDFEGDGHPDILMTHNFYPNQIETGPFAGGLGLYLRGDGKGGFTPVWPGESGIYVPEDARSLVIADFSGDRWPDVVVGINDGPLKFFENRGVRGGAGMLRLRLEGPAGNPEAIGARLMVTTNRRRQAFEVSAGGSYLGQSSPDLFVGLASGEAVDRIEVRWPDGSSSTFVDGFESGEATLKFR